MKNIILIICVISFSMLFSCKKYLDEKPDKALVVPQTIDDFQALLDNNTYMNQKTPSIGETSSDNYFLRLADYNACFTNEKNAYVWDTAIYTSFPNDWALAYQPVYFSNTVLDNIGNIARSSQNAAAWDNLKGCALFFRSRSLLTALWNWAKAYDKSTANNDLGIPLRTTSDFNTISSRATIEQCYALIIDDLSQAAALLPNVPVHPMRPSKPGAFALLARTYLARRQYDSCLVYADKCLQIKNSLIDYNTLTATSTYPVARFNDEVIFHNRMGNYYYNLQVGCIDTVLYNQYAANDLRKTIFFKSIGGGYYTFKGSYDNSIYPFAGIATDEVYLMRGESYARTGNTSAAMLDLNALLIKRWKTGTFVPLTASSATDALNMILAERRKELIWRDLRWMDIKRFNKEGANISLQRLVNGVTTSLQANDNRFALPIPSDIISLSGMQQNPR